MSRRRGDAGERAEETKLDPTLVAKFSRFDGVVRRDAEDHHPPADAHGHHQPNP